MAIKEKLNKSFSISQSEIENLQTKKYRLEKNKIIIKKKLNKSLLKT